MRNVWALTPNADIDESSLSATTILEIRLDQYVISDTSLVRLNIFFSARLYLSVMGIHSPHLPKRWVLIMAHPWTITNR